MAAWGIEELKTIGGETEFRLRKFQYKWQLKKWVAERPDFRHGSKQSDPLDRHLVVKALRSTKWIFRDTRRVKVEQKD